jgi:hypothetical protein
MQALCKDDPKLCTVRCAARHRMPYGLVLKASFCDGHHCGGQPGPLRPRHRSCPPGGGQPSGRASLCNQCPGRNALVGWSSKEGLTEWLGSRHDEKVAFAVGQTYRSPGRAQTSHGPSRRRSRSHLQLVLRTLPLMYERHCASSAAFKVSSTVRPIGRTPTCAWCSRCRKRGRRG